MTGHELLQPIIEFLGDHAPFDQIELAGRSAIAGAIEISYHRRGSEVQSIGGVVESVLVVRSGALSEWDENGMLVRRYGEGDCANVEGAQVDAPRSLRFVCHEDSLLYSIPASKFRQLLGRFPPLADSFSGSLSLKLKRASLPPSGLESTLGGTAAAVSSLLRRPLVSVDASTRISDAARLMNRERVSCLLVTGADELGIVTDRDFRSRVVASERSLDVRVASVMSSPVRSVEAKTPIFEALLSMVSAEVHHLAVVEGGHPVGMITTTDLIRLETENPVYVVSDIRKQESLSGVVQVVEHRRDRVLERLVNSGAQAVDIHRVLTLIGDAVTRQLIQIYERESLEQGIGALPDFCWVALGSQARYELNLGSDQDNAMILGADVAPDDPSARWLAQSVCAGLAACGYPQCPGDVMASTPSWRQPLSEWRRCFERWIREPAKMATMQASIFFDMRAVAGSETLVSSLLETVGPLAKEQSIFRAHMAQNALSLRPPLGLFRKFVLESGGEHKDTLDLKHRGLAPVVGLARLFALETGYTGANTLERLSFGVERGSVSQEGASELRSAYEWIALLRLKHQSRCLMDGRAPDSFVSPDELSSSDRRHLHDAFRAIKSMQDSVQMSRQLGALG